MSTGAMVTPRTCSTPAMAAAISALKALTEARTRACSAESKTLPQGGAGSCRGSRSIDRRSSAATGSVAPAVVRQLVTSPAARRSAAMPVGSGRFATAIPACVSASASSSARNRLPNSAGVTVSAPGLVLVAISSTSLFPSQTRRKLGRSSRARLTCDTPPARSGSPRIRNLRTSRPCTSPVTSWPAMSSGAIFSNTLAVSSPGTARLRPRRPGSDRKPRPPCARRTSPRSSRPLRLPSTIASCGGTPGWSTSGCGSFTRARRAMNAGALSTCPGCPFPTNPPEPNPASTLSPTTTRRRRRNVRPSAADTAAMARRRLQSTSRAAPIAAVDG